jgi:proton glutamate symport protein
MSDAASNLIGRLFLNPISVVGGVVLGGLYGWYDQGNTPLIEHLGEGYLRLLQMCVIPLLFTAVVTSLGKLFSDGSAKQSVARFVVIIAIGLCLAGVVGLLVAAFGRPGAEMQHQARTIIGEIIFRAEAASSLSSSADFMGIAVAIVPENIFLALSTGNMLAILFFAVLFGIALGSIDPEMSARALGVFESLYETFIKIIGWLTYVLPIGLFCLAYSQLSSIGVPVLLALVQLVALIYAGALALVAGYTALIWWKTGESPLRVLSALKDAIFVAFGTSSSFAAMPAALRGLKTGLRIDRGTVDLVMPLGITLNPPGSVFHFALASMFIANLYGVHLDAGQMVFVVVASALAGLAAAGAPGIAALSMMSLILVPLGLPVEVAIILLVAIDPVIDPIITVLNVQANSATTVLMARHPKKPGAAPIGQPGIAG